MIQTIGRSPDVWRLTLGTQRVTNQDDTARLDAPYSFAINGARRFCGDISFFLARVRGRWTVAHIVEVQRVGGCAK